MDTKTILIEQFNSKVKGRTADVQGKNINHDGKKGHWLEEQFGIEHNAENSADIDGYELKNETTSKTTFGDWSANRYIFSEGEYINLFKGKRKKDKQNSFLEIFGRANANKGNRLSWSGSVCPKLGNYNFYGQKLKITEDKDIVAFYSYDEDQRENKADIVPEELQKNELVLARWFGKESPSAKKKDECLKIKLERKFNQKGWFTCKTNNANEYEKICFGKPLTFDEWMKLVEDGTVFFDSGMHYGNSRAYSQWRASNSYWESLIEEEY